MNWTDEQLAAIFDQMCQSGAATCPTDGARLCGAVNRDMHGFTVSAQCSHCGASMRMDKGEDPRRGEFRPWTATERAELADAHVRGYQPICPVEGTPVYVNDTSTMHGAGFFMRCFRCDQTHSVDVPH